MRPSLFALCIAVCTLSSDTFAADWPQWLGPRRDSVWRESGVIQRIPEQGLEVKWRVPVGWGYAGPAVSDGRVYLMDYVHKAGMVTNSAGTRDHLEGVERVVCFDAGSGTFRWTYENERPYDISYPKGPRCTPTVADGKVYALGAEGDLYCLDAQSGKLYWTKNFVSEYNAEVPQWGFTNHPLVDKQLVYCVVGGKGSVAVAFDKNTGKEAWRALTADEPGYCPPTMLELGGKKHLIIWHSESINSLDPATGEIRWSREFPPRYGLATAAPRLVGDQIFASGAGVSTLLDASTGEILWTGTPRTSMACTMSAPIIDDGVIYGNDGSGTVIAANVEDGSRLWETSKPIARRPQSNGTVFLVKNGDRFFLFNDSGDLILASLTKAGYEELGRFHVLAPTNYTGSRDVVWSHPAFAEKCLFARNDKELVCVSLAAD